MSQPVIPTFTGTLEPGQRIEHVQTGHLGTVLEHNCGDYYIRWDAALPARWFEARLIKPHACTPAAIHSGRGVHLGCRRREGEGRRPKRLRGGA